MNIVSKVTWMYMKKNRKRTLVTIFGVIISVAMIMAVLISIDSFLDMFRRKEIETSGSWIAEYQNINIQQWEMLKNNEEISTVMALREVGYSQLEADADTDKPYIYTEAADANAMADMNLTVTQGRLPQKSGEIVLEADLNRELGDVYAIGDIIELELGHREMDMDDGTVHILGQDANYQNTPGYEERFVSDGKTQTYTIVGFIETPPSTWSWAPGYNAITFFNTSALSDDLTFNARVIFNKIDSRTYKVAADISEEINAFEYRIHEGLLRYYGVTSNDSMNVFLRTIGSFLICIIMAGSVMLIYNAFAISLSERSRQLGMLSSIGATKAQKRRSVLFEGLVIGSISIPLGILAGIGGMAVTFKLLSPMVGRVVGDGTQIRCTVQPVTVVVAVGLAVVTILISSWIPAVRASKITPIDSIRQNKDIKLTRRQVKTSKLTRILFGFEGELALKNLKRNKKSYRVTVISLVLSFTLFLSVAGYVTMLRQIFVMTDNTNTYDVYAVCGDDSETAISLCTSLDAVDDYNVVTNDYCNAYFSKEDTSRIITDQYREYADMDRLYIDLRGMPEDKLIEYMKNNGMDTALVENYEEGSSSYVPVVIVNRYNMVTGDYEWTDMTVADISLGEKFSLSVDSYDSEGNSYETKDAIGIQAAGVTDALPMGFTGSFFVGTNIYVITLDSCVDEINQRLEQLGYDNYPSTTYIYMSSDDPETLTASVKDIYDNYRGDITGYYSIWETEQSDKALMTMLQVFCYGFIALMTLICTANILNTVSTGIDLRRREFAMLKSVGMTQKAFNRMLVFESLFYGIKTLIYGLPLGVVIMVWEYYMMREQFTFPLKLPFTYLIGAIVVLMLVVSISMAYSFGKVRRENILDGLRTE